MSDALFDNATSSDAAMEAVADMRRLQMSSAPSVVCQEGRYQACPEEMPICVVIACVPFWFCFLRWTHW